MQLVARDVGAVIVGLTQPFSFFKLVFNLLNQLSPYSVVSLEQVPSP
jgi:hypothetical protein